MKACMKTLYDMCVCVCYFVLSVCLSLCNCPHISGTNLIKADQSQTCLPLITWGGGDGCYRRGNDAAGVEGGELLHLNRRHRGNRREVGRLCHQGLLLHQLADRQTERGRKRRWLEEVPGQQGRNLLYLDKDFASHCKVWFGGHCSYLTSWPSLHVLSSDWLTFIYF